MRSQQSEELREIALNVTERVMGILETIKTPERDPFLRDVEWYLGDRILNDVYDRLDEKRSGVEE